MRLTRRPRPAQLPPRFLVFLVAVLTALLPASAQGNDDCLACHEDVHVDPATYSASVHGRMDCVFCHSDVDPDDLPHADDLEPVDCSMCHDREAADHRRSLHGQAARRGDPMAPTCADCHGSHDIRSHTDPRSPTAVLNIPTLCGTCHREGSPVSRTHAIPQDRILENYSMSIHGEGLYRQGLTVSAVCTSCHTSHRILPHTDPESSIHHERVAETCARCHGQIEQVHRTVIDGRLWQEEPDKIPACVDCHSPHRIRRVLYPSGLATQDCLRCHGDPGLTTQRDGATVSLFVDGTAYAAGEHAGTACAQCHTGVSVALSRPCETLTTGVDCSVCHADQVQRFEGSTHGRLRAAGDGDAPGCGDCHDPHFTTGKDLPSSRTFARNVPTLCGSCHRVGAQAAVRIHRGTPDIVGSYGDSIHGKGLVDSGLLVTATCVSCHTAHGELPPDDTGSTVHRDNIADTCGRCHHGVEETFKTSVHWPDPGRAADAPRLPTCDDCHSSHNISRADQGNFRLNMMDQCGRCHAAESATFFDTFHGKVSRLGAEAPAKCQDCHGTHDILPTADPRSSLSRDNVVATCGKCHAGSHRQFAGYLTHATHHDSQKYPFLFYAFWGMTILLVGTLTFAMLHTGAWLVRLWLSRDQWRQHRAEARASSGKLYRRFNRFQRMLHMLMLISFFTLAFTGMALKFSYMGWALALSRALGGFEVMGLLHRMGAIVLFAVAVLHLWGVWSAKRKARRSWREVLFGPDSILFNLRDLTEVRDSIKWFFGLGPRPRYGRYTYWEKFDYLAVFWGVIVIGSSGLLLWFPELFTRVLPGWSVNVATIIHSDEALLAVAFIFTVHFFNTHFRPDKFPMDPVIFTGRITLAELQYDKPREYEERLKSGDLDEHLVDAFPGPAERGLRIFGFVALGVGLTLIALIVYAMLFGYR